jgi:hypothetical protein
VVDEPDDIGEVDAAVAAGASVDSNWPMIIPTSTEETELTPGRVATRGHRFEHFRSYIRD